MWGSGYLINNIGAPQKDTLGWMNFLFNKSCSWSFSFINSIDTILYSINDIGSVPRTKSMQISMSFNGENPGKSLEKTLMNSLTITPSSFIIDHTLSFYHICFKKGKKKLFLSKLEHSFPYIIDTKSLTIL
jgi:hypothetical protein